MKLSIAMCTFNGASYLRQQLDSISHQTRLPDEMIICDDASADNTLSIINDFAMQATFPVFVYHNNKNLGINLNFEQAIKLCTGDVIALADQDDLWHTNKLNIIMNAFEKNQGISYIFTNAKLIDQNSDPINFTLWNSVNFNRKDYQQFCDGKQIHLFLKRNIVTGTTLAIRANLKEFIFPISKYCVHDNWIAMLASAIGAWGLPINNSLVSYRLHANQQIGTSKSTFDSIRLRFSARKNDSFINEIKMFQDLKSQLNNIPEETFNHNKQVVLKLLDQKIALVSNRKLIQSSKGTIKLMLIFLEIVKGNYHRFSNYAWHSIGRDLFYFW